MEPAQKPTPRGPEKYRAAEIKKIQIAKRWACDNLPGFDDDAYRDLLRECSKDAMGKAVSSSTDLNWRGRMAVLKRFEELGWEPQPAKGARTFPPPGSGGGQGVVGGGISRRQADDDQSRMARGIWIDLHKLGEVRDPSEKALNGFVKRMTGIADLHWCKDRQKYTVIEALKDMRARRTMLIMQKWCMDVYLREIPGELAAKLQTVLRGLRIGEQPRDTSMERLGGAGYRLLVEYKKWEGVAYGR